MADSTTSEIKLNQDHSLIYAKKLDYYAMSIRDWDRLKRVVKNCNFVSEKYSVISSFAFGIAGSSLVGILTLPISNDSKSLCNIVLLFAIVLGVSIGILCLYFHNKEKKLCKYSLNEVLNEIKEIENSFNSTAH